MIRTKNETGLPPDPLITRARDIDVVHLYMSQSKTRTPGKKIPGKSRPSMIGITAGVIAAVVVVIIVFAFVMPGINNDNAAKSHDIPGVDTSKRIVTFDETSGFAPFQEFSTQTLASAGILTISTPQISVGFIGLAGNNNNNESVAATFHFTSVNQLACVNGTARIFYGKLIGTPDTYGMLIHSNGQWYSSKLSTTLSKVLDVAHAALAYD